MKTRFSFLSMILSLSIFILSFSSCEKEPLHNYDPGVVQDVSSDDDDKPVRLPKDGIDQLEDGDLLEPNTTFSEALNKFGLENHSKWGIAIKSIACTRGGQTLIVHNPNNSDLNYYDSKRYAIYWFKDGKLLQRSTDNELACVCKGKYDAIVINRTNKTGVGMAYHFASRCDFVSK